MKRPWMCFWERRFFHNRADWLLEHDGQRNPGQFEFPPGEILYYTRTYRLQLGGELQGTWVRFRYDLREEEATVDLTWHEPGENDKETLVMAGLKEASDG